jgi:glycosyltransferase involved in cell wall biosynthesis
MDTMPRVSVIIPTYNRSNLLRETIASVLRQTFNDLEIIVVDDGSTDDTRTAVEAINDRRLRYFYKDNGGTPAARNFGLARALGEYVSFLDHDDWWPENFLEVMITHLIKKTDYGVAYTPITKVTPDGNKIRSYKVERSKSGWITTEFFKHGFVVPSAAVIRRSVLENFYFDEALRFSYEDSDFFLRLSVRTPFLFVREVEAFYRSSPDSLSAIVGTACTKILTLERFYYHLGGDKIVPARIARRKISHACRKVAESYRENKKRRAAISLYKRAIKYCPLDTRLYIGLLQSFLLDSHDDHEPDWEMSAPLDMPDYRERYSGTE